MNQTTDDSNYYNEIKEERIYDIPNKKNEPNHYNQLQSIDETIF
jgi:hypothetical protein